MKPILSITALVICLSSSAQDSFYTELEMGKYDVGFFDTLLYSDSSQYNQYGYTGPAPLFVQVWHPIKPTSEAKHLCYGDFRNRKLPVPLSNVYEKLNSQAKAVFIEANIATDLSTYEAIDYISFSYEDVLEKIKTTRTKSIYSRIQKKTKYPVIVYHHGTQGVSDENYVMAEYFASKGYIFVTANFHLPYTELIYGLSESVTNDQSKIKTVIDFAKTLSSNQHTFYAGHSWGAQTGWCFLHEGDWADAFVSLETTIEYKTDTAQIKDMWPYVYDVVKTKNRKYEIPILMFANTQLDEPFHFFKNSCTKELYSVSIKEYFEHNSFTSVFLMRYFWRTAFTQPDTEILNGQLKMYILHLEMMDDFFQSVMQKKQLDPDNYTADFYFN
ncbi:MAG: hypothetical protein IPO32_14145 [Crocinitomicaceae bacterium]|nr:hypothetical protein [Crocinitomicaceae bacterium]